MSGTVHPTAVVDPTATLGPEVTVDPFAIIGPQVVVGEGTRVGARATIQGPTRVGAGCTIGAGVMLGLEPQDLKYAGEPTSLEIGDETTIREFATVHRGTQASGATRIGRRCYLMTYVHVAHDCRLGDGVVLANAVQLAGHVEIEDFAQVSGLTPIHQFVRIGTHAFVGGGSRVPQDVPPYTMTAGNPMRSYGINVEGLRRAGFDSEVRLALKRAYRWLFNSDQPRDACFRRIRTELGHVPEVMRFVDFVASSGRGVLV